MRDAAAKSLLSLKAYRSESDIEGPKVKTFILFDGWENVLQSAYACNADAGECASAVERIKRERTLFQQALINELLNQETVVGKQLLVEITHRKLLRLADSVYRFNADLTAGGRAVPAFLEIEGVIADIFQFIEEFFGNHLNGDRPAPHFLKRQMESELTKNLEHIEAGTSEGSGGSLGIVCQSVSDIFGKGRNLSVKELLNAKQLVTEIGVTGLAANENRFRDRLYFMNFNEENFVMAEFERLNVISESATDKNEKLAALRLEHKRINQLPISHREGWTEMMPSLKEQINGWINEEIRFVESGNYLPPATTDLAENSEKIQTSLSVAKLAVIIRLLVIDKIIINRNVAPMLRVVAKLFTTLQRDEISYGSLQTKYHAPDKVTINAVRDMLFKWINILGKL